jgi:hypothetical protein
VWRVRLVVATVLAAFLGTFLAVLLLAILYLPWWAWLVIATVVALLPVTARLIIRWKVRSFLKELDGETPPGMPPFFAAAFKMKGSVLRKARVVVHSIQPAEAPPPLPPETASRDAEQASVPSLGSPALPPPETPEAGQADEHGAGEGKAPGGPPRDYYLLDVTIQPTRRGIGFRRWQPGELALTALDGGCLDADASCQVVSVEVEQGGAFAPEDDMRYAGKQRLRLLVGVRRGVERLAFRYYTEQFGEVVLPATGRTTLA